MAIAKPALAIKGDRFGLVIDGHVEGIVAHHKMHLTVGKRGRVNGQVHASYITVLGQVFGEIRSDGIVSLAKGANVEGGIFCARVLIEDGARFKGQIQMGESPDITVSNDPARGKSVRSGKTSIIAA